MLQAVILAGGLATRLGRLTADCPKSMVRVCSRPFIDYQVDLLRENGLTDVVLCLGHLSERVEKHLADGGRHGVKITYSRETELLGTAGALKNAQRHIKGDFLVLYGDSYLDFDYGSAISFFEGRKHLALMTVYRNHDRYDASNTAVSGGLVTRYSKVNKTPDMVYIDHGLSLFRKQALDLIPAGRPYQLSELFPQLIERRELLAYEVERRFYEIGSPAGLNEFREFAEGRNDSLARAG
jgi:NDP-sugar pyrophosphorylase family protein